MSVDKKWKRQIARIRQIADQGLGLAQSSSVLSDNLQDLEGRLEDIRTFCQTASKRLQACLSGNVGTDVDKRLKKLPLYSFASSLNELKQQSMFDVLGKTLTFCYFAEDKLAKELIRFEIDVEDKFLQPIRNITEKDIPGIVKMRKELANLTLDMDAAKNKLTRQQKGDDSSLREELENAEMKVEQCKDLFSAEIYSFVSREDEFCRVFLSLLKTQAEHHRRSLAELDKILPQISQEIELHATRPVFGTSLESHLKHTDHDIATVIEMCVCTLYNGGLEEEGLFRIAAGSSKVKKMKAAFDAGLIDMEEYQTDMHCVADVLKQYLRTLPEPLMTFDLYNEWMSVTQMPADRRPEEVRRILTKLPRANLRNLEFLIKFLAKLVEKSDVNKMSASNLAIVIGPNLLWPRGDRTSNFQVGSSTVELLINKADYFFPDDIDFSNNGSSSSESSPCPTRHNRQSPRTDMHGVVMSMYGTLPSARSNGAVQQPLETLDTGSNSSLLGVDTSPRTGKKYRKNQAPPPPPTYRPAPLSPGVVPTATPTPAHRRTASVDSPNQARHMMTLDRPTIPPPAPPTRKPEIIPRHLEKNELEPNEKPPVSARKPQVDFGKFPSENKPVAVEKQRPVPERNEELSVLESLDSSLDGFADNAEKSDDEMEKRSGSEKVSKNHDTKKLLEHEKLDSAAMTEESRAKIAALKVQWFHGQEQQAEANGAGGVINRRTAVVKPINDRQVDETEKPSSLKAVEIDLQEETSRNGSDDTANIRHNSVPETAVKIAAVVANVHRNLSSGESASGNPGSTSPDADNIRPPTRTKPMRQAPNRPDMVNETVIAAATKKVLDSTSPPPVISIPAEPLSAGLSPPASADGKPNPAARPPRPPPILPRTVSHTTSNEQSDKKVSSIDDGALGGSLDSVGSGVGSGSVVVSGSGLAVGSSSSLAVGSSSAVGSGSAVSLDGADDDEDEEDEVTRL